MRQALRTHVLDDPKCEIINLGAARRTCADITKARERLGYQPETLIDDGLQKFADWVENYHADRPVDVSGRELNEKNAWRRRPWRGFCSSSIAN